MKRKLLLIGCLILMFYYSFAQNTFFSFYDTIPQPSHAAYFFPGIFVGCGNDHFIGITMLDIPQNKSLLYKFDVFGNMHWWRELTFPIYNSPPLDLAFLSDSTVGILFYTLPPYSAIVAKADPNGTMLWTKTLTITPGSASFTALSATTDGGIILTGGACAGKDLIMHLDSNGNILSQHSHVSPSNNNAVVADIFHDGNNEYTCCGVAPVIPNNPFIFFKTDSAGNIADYSEIFIPQGFANSWSLTQLITKATNNGHYCIFPTSLDVSRNKFALFYFNSQSQLVWSKFIETQDTVFIADGVIATSDNGCVVIGGNTFQYNPNIYLPVIMKFDSLGNMNWIKIPGDISIPYWNKIRHPVSISNK